MKKLFEKTGDDGWPMYQSECGFTMKRETGLTPNGNELHNRWVLRNDSGEFVDFDKYRHDLDSRNGFELVSIASGKSIFT